ncbi:LLM class flavin-dependent oxidoreductase [Marinimicrobium alkaliphilum]|uniref:LLM class flavin-dependent oxidoreductase n=1 Tax=Marinimicrobium alkaliphilum TaxID=2202654 RepID=UPI000DBAB93E|nr:LLM class flavin-dependent oxidoreductase [Marinimicrobium alkaliphilum]
MSLIASTPFSLLDLAHLRDNGSYAEAYAELVDTAREAERLGYRRFWLAEHHNMDGIGSSATAVLIGQVAAATHHIRVGSGGIMLPNHPPLTVAEAFGTLAELFPERIDLGIGRAPGSDMATARALRRRRDDSVDDFPEQLAELQAFLGPAQAGQRVLARPGCDTRVPVWLLGSSLFSAQLAGQRGLPYAFAAHFAPRHLIEALHVYRASFTPSEALTEPYVAVAIPFAAADTDERARTLFTTMQQSILSLVRGESLRLKPPVASMEGLWTPGERQSVDSFHDYAVVGGPDSVREQLEAVIDLTGADELIFSSSFYHHQDRLQSLRIAADLQHTG